MVNVKRIFLLAIPLATMTAQAATVTRPRVELRPGVNLEMKPTVRTSGAERTLELNGPRDLESLHAQPVPQSHISVSRSADSLTQDGVQKINGFTTKLLSEILKDEKDKNVFITGPAMVSAITMLSNGANDRARAELMQTLGYSEGELEKLNSQAASLLSRMNTSSDAVTVKMANSFFADESLVIVPQYKSLVQSRFDATVKNVQFAVNPEAAASTINQWAHEKTNGMISKIIDKDSAANLAALLASSVYFKGKWETQFDTKKTYEEPFHLENGQTVNVPMMHGEMDVEAVYNKENNYLILRLPYRGKSASMYIVFPTARWSEPPTIKADQALLLASKSGELSHFHTASEKVLKMKGEDVFLPKFAIKYSNGKLKKIFEAMGVDKVFHGGSLTNLSPDQRLFVSYIKMDTALEVDEEGSKAAGVATIGMALESMRSPQFVFDRPFGVIIRDEASGIDLFSGVIRNPKP